MRIPPTAIIPPPKLTQYLLVPRRRNDKSKYLARGGFTPSNPSDLERAIRQAIANFDAYVDDANEHGVYYRVDATLEGVNGVLLDVALIWIEWRVDGSFRLVTLKPRR